MHATPARDDRAPCGPGTARDGGVPVMEGPVAAQGPADPQPAHHAGNGFTQLELVRSLKREAHAAIVFVEVYGQQLLVARRKSSRDAARFIVGTVL